MSVKISKQKAVEIAQLLGVDPEPKREIILDPDEILKLATVSELDVKSYIEICFTQDSKTTAELLSKELIVDITNYNSQF